MKDTCFTDLTLYQKILVKANLEENIPNVKGSKRVKTSSYPL